MQWSPAPRIGLDMGTGKTVLWSGRRIVFNEPTLLVVDPEKNRVLHTGTSAGERRGRINSGSELLRPVRRGVVADYAATVYLLKHVLARSKRFRMLKPMIVAGACIQMSSVESRALCDAAREAGAGAVFLVPGNLASFWLATESLEEPTGSLVVDMGAGVTNVSVIASNQVIVGRTLPLGGDEITALVQRVMEVSYGVQIGHTEAERVKMELGVGFYDDEILEKLRSDPDDTGAFRKVNISKKQVAEFLLRGIDPLFSGILRTLEETPPELFEDIFRKGMILSGGASLLPGLRRRLQNRLNLNVNRLPDPSLSVIKGIGKIISQFNFYREYFMNQQAV